MGLFGGPQIQPGRNTDNAGLFDNTFDWLFDPSDPWRDVILHEEEELAKKSVGKDKIL